MEITREADYAVRCVLYLSSRPEQVVMIDEMAKEMDIPRSFLAKILQKLAKASIVMSFRGVKGGFQLTRKPSLITLLDVVEASEGPVKINRCAYDKKSCNFSGHCGVHPSWVELRKLVCEYLQSVDFETLKKSSKMLRSRGHAS